MNADVLVPLGIVWFIGMTIGWFFRNGISLLGIIVLFTTAPIFALIADIDSFWPTTVFIAGLLTHTYKPLLRKIKSL